MKALLALLLAGAAAPALAQHRDHSTEAPAAEMTCTPEHAAMGHCTMPAEAAAADPHAGHQMPAEEPAADPHAGHQMPADEPPADPHAGHRVEPSAQPPIAPPPREALSRPEHAADTIWGDTAMALARRELRREHGGLRAYRVLVDRLEARIGSGRDGYAFDGDAWYGGDIDKLWLKAEGEGEFGGRFEGAEVQALWSHAIDPWFDVQGGVRYDAKRGPDRAHLVLGLQGLAPYWIEIDAAAFLSDKGDLTASFEAEHDARITQRLILQPRGELQFALQDVPDQGVGSGLSEFTLGARLRYEVTQLFAPYVGIEYGRAVGETRRFRRLHDEELGGVRLLLGLRTWF